MSTGLDLAFRGEDKVCGVQIQESVIRVSRYLET